MALNHLENSADTMSILNPHPTLLPGPSLLHKLIGDQDTPGEAIEYHDSNGLQLTLSYRDLHQRADTLACVLSAHRTSRTTPSIVPLLIPQCAALYISQIAILKSGSAFCPINLDVPEERLEFILSDVSAEVVITTEEHRSKFDHVAGLQVVTVDIQGQPTAPNHAAGTGSLGKGSAALQKQAPDTHYNVEPADPAYIMYTSGSTGTPKAVILSHRAVTQSLLAHDRFIPADLSRFLQFANPTFDVSVFEIYFPLFRKATLISCDRASLLSDLGNVITQLQVDAAELTPSVVASLVRTRQTVPRLRCLLTIGEMLNPQTVREFADDDEDHSLLYGMYGPTEAAIHCTLQPKFRKRDTVNTIGVPLDTVSCFIIKPTEEVTSPDDIQIVPQGQVGELAVGGHQLADGYLNREEQTKAVFVSHPVYGSLYRTGDKAKLTSSGLLECLGRISKGQVKLRGQRIELGEIEHAASKLKGVHAAAASVIEGQLILFCVADPSEIEPSDIDSSCRKWLPRYMVPNDIVMLSDFPYLPSGKTDQRKLDADYKAKLAQGPTDQEIEEPDDGKLLKILRTNMDKSIKPSSKLAAKGLDSLKAIRLAGELRKHGYHQLSAVDVLSCITCNDLLALVSRLDKAKRSEGISEYRNFTDLQAELSATLEESLGAQLPLDQLVEVFPCTPVQDAMLVETTKNPAAYWNHATFALHKDVSFDRFRTAIASVVDRHSALRSGFVESPHTSAAFVQLVWKQLIGSQVSAVPRLGESHFPVGASDLVHPVRIEYTSAPDQNHFRIFLHHALYDQWSLDILVDDMYLALRSEIPPARPSFAECSRLALQTKSSRTRQADLTAFWKSYLASATISRLPNLTGKIKQSDTLGSVQRNARVPLPEIVSLAASYKISTSALVQAVYGYLLSLYVGQTDYVFGSVHSGRTAAIEDIENVVGPLLATLPSRISIASGQRFRELGRSVHQSNRKVMAHTDFPLVDIKKAANINAGDMLFDSIFVWQGSPRQRIRQDNIRLLDTSDHVEFALILDAEPDGDVLSLKITHRQRSLPTDQAGLLLDQIDLVLERLKSYPNCHLKDLFVDVTPRQCLSIYNPEPEYIDCTGGLKRLMQQSFGRNWSRPALYFAKVIGGQDTSDDTLTYEQLWVRSNRVANELQKRGTKPSSLICVFMDKSVDLYVVILAIIKIGCGYLPITPGTPHQRLIKILDDAAVRTVVCDELSRASLKGLEHTDLLVADAQELSQGSVKEVATDAQTFDVAYAVYTSGTTGTPKGVLITHENICSNLVVLADIYPADDSSRILQACNQSFDVSVFEIFFAWFRGMCLCSATNDALFRDLETAIRSFGITHLSLTPTVASLLDARKVPDVRYLITAGESMTETVRRRWSRRALFQGYGPSETTNICSVNAMMREDDSINNIGQTLINTSTFVLPLDGGFTPLPTGALGELCFGGQQVFREYQRLPDTTASRMVSHPHYGRIYRSGDLGRLRHDGTILIEGRQDTQCKIRGQRVELGEITAKLLDSDIVSDATTLVIGSHGNETLVSFWIPTAKASMDYCIIDPSVQLLAGSVALLHKLQEFLPSYMVPSVLVPVSSFPTTRQGKIDNDRLEEDFEDLSEEILCKLSGGSDESLEEWTETEQFLGQILSDVLKIPKSSFRRNTALFGFGLDSISAIRVAAKVKQHYECIFDVSMILKSPRIEALAKLVDSRSAYSTSTSISEAKRIDHFLKQDERQRIGSKCADFRLAISQILPCTPLQEAMVSASMTHGVSAYLNRTILKLIDKSVDLKSICTLMVERHDILRTIFMTTGDQIFPFVQVVKQTADLPWDDLEGTLSEDDLMTKLATKVTTVVDSPTCPYAITIYSRPDDDRYFIIDMHHALYDANAFANLLSDMESALKGEKLLEPVTFGPFLEHMLSSSVKEANAFFADMLHQYRPHPIPASPNSANDVAFATVRGRAEINDSELKIFQKTHSVSFLSILQAGWANVCAILFDSGDVCFGNVVSGRTVPVPNVDRLVAPCFNTLPVRGKLNHCRDALELVQQLHQINIDSLSHQLTPLRRIQKHQRSQKRLFDTLLLLQQSQRPLDASLWTLVSEKGDMDFPCIVEVTPGKDAQEVSIHYHAGVFPDNELATKVCKFYVDSVAQILGAPTSRLSVTCSGYERLRGTWKQQNRVAESSDFLDGSLSGQLKSDWTSMEAVIRDVLLALSSTGPKSVTKHTSIYRLGLDSINAIQAANQLSKQGLSVSVADILEHPTPADLANHISSNATKPGPKRNTDFDLQAFEAKILPKLPEWVNDKARARPCTAIQAGMLSVSIKSKGRQYVNHFAYDISWLPAPEKIVESWKEVIKSVDMLRTGFAELDDKDHPFIMLIGDRERFETPIEILREGQPDLDCLASEHEDEIVAELRRPAWRCKILMEGRQHKMFLSMHHALYDAVSLAQILEWLRLSLDGQPFDQAGPIDPAISHVLGSGQPNIDTRDFWTNSLKQASPVRFPNLHPVTTSNAEMLEVSLVCQSKRSTLENLCSDRGTSLQAVFQAAWAKVLSAYLGEDQVTFGVVQSGRATSATQDACFPCINTLPLTCDASLSDQKLLNSLVQYNVSIQRHTFTPLAYIQQWLGLHDERLFDTIFAYQKPMHDEDTSNPWRLLYERAAVEYAVSIEIEHLANEVLRLRTTFNSQVLPQAQAKVMLQQLQTVALRLMGQEDEPGSIPLAILPAKESVIRSEFSLLQDMVNFSVSENSGRCALEWVEDVDDDKVDSRTWTYRELDEIANRVARLLHSRGVKPGDVVGLYFDKCPEAAFAFLGILKAGACILAIDVTAPSARKDFVIQDSRATAVLCKGDKVHALPDIEGVAVVSFDLTSLTDIASDPVDLPTSVTPQSLSYILYTSGTTGTPKGCEITHENAVQALLAFQRLFSGRWNPDSVWLQFASYHFDVAILEHFWTWSVGMKVLCASRDLTLEDIASFISRFSVSHLDLTPSLGRLLDPASVPSLHDGVFITGGEAVKPEMLRKWGKIGCLFNFYGPTECTIGVTTYPSVPINGKAANIGWQFDNVGTCVLKPGTNDPVIRGGVGELCIFGKLVGKGYLNRPDLNEKCFPFISAIHERVYRTGDVVRLLHNNSFEFLGRGDSQVKLRGQRLELDEILAVMLSAEAVEDAACIVAREPSKQKDQLVAFLSSSSNRIQGTLELEDDDESRKRSSEAKLACEDRLPGYMVPSHFIPIPFVPLSVNNKQDDKALRQFFQSLSTSQLQGLSTSTSDNRPLNNVERDIIAALGDIIGTEYEGITPDANLFALGLSSITAMQLARRLKKSGYGVASVTSVMQNPTIKKLAKSLQSSTTSSDDGEVLAAKQIIALCCQRYLGHAANALHLQIEQIEKILPCTPLQQGILYKSQSTNDGLYFNRFLFDVSNLDLGKLQEAFRKLIGHNEILRTVFLETEDGPLQVIKKSMDLPWHIIDSEDTIDDSRQQWIASNDGGIHQPFQIMFHKDSGTSTMQICIHHALYDGNSWSLLLEHIKRLYRDNKIENVLSFSDILPYGPLRVRASAKKFWQEHLRTSIFEPMPQLAHETRHQDSLVSRRIAVPQESQGIQKKLQVTPQSLIQAAWLVALSRYYAGPVGLVVSGRSLDVDAEQVIGPLFNTIPFAWTLHEGMTWSVLSKKCHDFNVASLPYQHTSLSDIAKWHGSSPIDPLFEALFVFQQPSTSSQDGVLLRPLEDQLYTADYPLSFEAEQLQDGDLTVTCGAQDLYFDRVMLDALIDDFETNLRSLLEDPDQILDLHDEYMNKITAGHVKRVMPDLNGFTGEFRWTVEAQVLRTAMAQLAEVDEQDIDEHTTLFALGLDSIDIVKLSARLKKHDIIAPVSMVIRNQTIPKILAAAKHKPDENTGDADQASRQKQNEKFEAIVRSSLHNQAAVERVLPATPMQEALVSEMIRSDFQTYFNHDVMEIVPGIDLGRLEKAWQSVIETNPVLRTTFVPVESTDVDSTYAQIVLRPLGKGFMRHKIQEQAEFQDVLHKIAREVSGTPGEAPLRLTFVEQSEKVYLILSLAHSLYDGYSLDLLHKDVAAAYADKPVKRPDYVSAVEHALQSTGSDADSFWSSVMRNAVPSLLQGQEVPCGPAKRAELISSTSSDALRSACRKFAIAPQALAQTAWALFLSSISQKLDVMYGLVLAGRDTPEAEQIMFPTMNTVIARNVIAGTGQEMVRAMQEQLVNIRNFQATPLRRIQRLAKQHCGIQGPLVDSLFTFQRGARDTAIDQSKPYKSIEAKSDVEMLLAVEAEISGDQLIWRCAIQSQLLHISQPENTLATIDSILSALLDKPHSEVTRFEDGKVSVMDGKSFPVGVGGETNATGGGVEEANTNTNPTPALTDLERTIRDAVAQVAKVSTDEIAPMTRLDNLGIDSISAIKLSAMLKKSGLKISVSEIIKSDTIRGIAEYLGNRSKQSQPTESVDVTSLLRDRGLTALALGLDQKSLAAILPATAGQIYMMSTWLNSEGRHFYPTFTYSVSEPFSNSALEKAWQTLVDRHAILRTSLIATADPDVPYIQAVRKHRSVKIGIPSQGQPYANLSVERNHQTQLKLSIHHALYDAVSLQHMMQDLALILSGNSPQTSTNDMAAFTSTYANPVVQDEQHRFWAGYLADVTHAAPKQRAYSGGKVEVFSPSTVKLGSGYQKKLRSEGISLQALFFAAYARHQAQLSSTQGDIIIGVYLANRSSEAAANLVGPTINLLPVRVASPTRGNIQDIARQIQTDLKLIGDEPINSTALWEIQRWTGVSVHVFLNFILLPEEDEDQQTGFPGAIKIESVDATADQEFRERAEVLPASPRSAWKGPKEVIREDINVAYPPSIDIEATVQDGHLAVGVFGYEGVVDLSAAKGILEGVRENVHSYLED